MNRYVNYALVRGVDKVHRAIANEEIDMLIADTEQFKVILGDEYRRETQTTYETKSCIERMVKDHGILENRTIHRIKNIISLPSRTVTLCFFFFRRHPVYDLNMHTIGWKNSL